LNIRLRNIVRNDENIIISGSATLVENIYSQNASGDRKKNHTKQTVIERLGRVVWIDDNDKSCGIFNSPERGIVFYDLKKDEFSHVEPTDPRLKGTRYHNTSEKIHTSFGNTYLFLSEMGKTPFMDVLRDTFTDTCLYQKVLAHVCHDCLKNGSAIKCGEFLSENFLSYLLTGIPYSTLDCDSSYFKELSDDNLKRQFFCSLVKNVRKVEPGFGRACYVDSTPLPGEAENNPFNALSSHGTDGALIQCRLVLILDIQTNIPVWFEIIPANVLDKSTILSITSDVKATLNIDIEMYDLDAGYARKELFELFNRNNSTYVDKEGVTREHTVLLRMPATNGYPKDDLYIRCKPHFYSGRYSFDYEHHTFFGEKVEIDLFGYPENAFVYIDKTQAESLLRQWRELHTEEWDGLSESAQDWYQVKDGFFILLGNKNQNPREALTEYRGRTSIETFFRDGKAYLRILPISKWNKQTVKGKIFHDIMVTIFYRNYRKNIASTSLSMSSLIVYMDSWECFKTQQNLLELKTPKLQTREILEKLGYAALGRIDLEAFKKEIFNGIPMQRTPITTRSNRNIKKSISPEEKLAKKEKEKHEQIRNDARKKYNKAEKKAITVLTKAEALADKKFNNTKTKAEKLFNQKLNQAKRDVTKEKAKIEYEQTIAKATLSYNEAKIKAKDRYNKDIEKSREKYSAAFTPE